MIKQAWVLGAVVLVTACGGDGNGIPASMDSGFDIQTDAFAFPNFVASQGALLGAASAERMFGADEACVNGASPCTLRPVAKSWVDAANRSVAEGRSEGFAVLSLLFFSGELDPADFGADTVAELSAANNQDLQAELAYWSATQSLPGVEATTQKFQASGVMPFLANVLRPDSEERYRLAIAIRTEDGFDHGHALTPIGYYHPERNGPYFLRVYDSNFPESEQLLEIDPVANSWRYESPVDEDTTLIYEGNAANGNLLYFSPVRARLGQLPAPFADDADTATVVSQGGVQALATWGDALVGIQDGELMENGGTVEPVFAACANCPNRGLLNYRMQGNGDFNLRISRGVGRGTAMGDVGATVNVTGSGFSAGVSGIQGDDQFQDELTVTADGSLSYRSMSDNGAQVNMSSNRGGVETSVSVQINGSSEEVRVSFDGMGRPTVNTRGIPVGEEITVVVETTDSQGMTIRTVVPITISGDDTQVIVDPETGARSVVVDGGTSPHCMNGMFDPGLEVGLDCRDTCEAKCAAGQPCNVQEDCVEGTRCWPVSPGAAPICQAPGCTDGLKNVDETDVDCGGPMCGTCTGSNTEPQACAEDRDCDTNICVGGLCRVTNNLSLQINDAKDIALTFNTTFDGVTTQRIITPATQIVSLVLGQAYEYEVSVDGPSGCNFLTTNFFSPPTGTTGGERPFEKYLQVRCSPQEDFQVSVVGLPEGAEIQLATTYDGVGGTRTLDQNGYFWLTKYRTDWSLTITAGPGTVDDVLYECAFGEGRTRGTVSGDGLTASASGLTARFPAIVCAPAGPRDLVLRTSGLPAGGTVGINTSVDGGGTVTTSVTANGDSTVASYSSSWNLEISSQPGNVGGTIYTCSFPGDSNTASGGRDTALAELTCAAGGAGSCVMDSDCSGSSNCYCGKDSGNCSGGGTCGAARGVFDVATTDCVASSGTFTVPADCSQVQVQAWGAAGGDGVSDMGFPVGMAGGAGGYVRGVWDVTEGDVITAWIGQGGTPTDRGVDFGTPGIGSNVGTRVDGGAGDSDAFSSFGGGGGGLTSVRLTGSATSSFIVPAGGGGTALETGHAVGGDNTGGAAGMDGESAEFGSSGGGGGAGAVGGTGGVFVDEAGAAGTYGALPGGFVSENGVGPSPANSSITDHGLCSGGDDGSIPAGGSSSMGFRGGDGCVVVRCVAP